LDKRAVSAQKKVKEWLKKTPTTQFENNYLVRTIYLLCLFGCLLWFWYKLTMSKFDRITLFFISNF